MIRRFTLICLVIAAFSGLHRYGIKRDAQVQDREITRISREAKEGHNRAALLHAEYDLLSDPERLKELAGQLLKLQATDPKQYVSLADFDKRVPAVAPLPAPPESPQTAEPLEASVAPPPAPVEQTNPEQVAHATPVPLPAEKSPESANDKASVLARMMEMVDQPAFHRTPAPSATTQQAQAVPLPPQIAAPPAKPVPATMPVAAPRPSALAESRPPQPQPLPPPLPQRPVQTASMPPAAPRPIPAVAAASQMSAPYVGSALGMARIHAAPARYVPSSDGN